MKRKINIITLIAATAIMATSCVKSYDSLFEDSAADRIQLGLKYYEDALLDGQTWIMEYFPSEDLKYGGWIYVLRFDENHNVRAWFEGETFIEDQSYLETPYAVEYSTGPMLKFVNHNSFLHYFAIPGYEHGYQGLEGEYEFSFMEITSTPEILLYGIKTDKTIKLSLLPGSYSPEEYVEAVRESQRIVRTNSLKFMVNGKEYGTLTRESSFDESSFDSYMKSKVWTLSYTYKQQVTDPTGAPEYDDEGNPIYEDVEVHDKLSFIHYPDNTMKLYEPYTFKGELEEYANQTMQTLEWKFGEAPLADHFVCKDSFLEIKFVQ